MAAPVTILCVDDEQNVLSALRRLFMDEEYDLVTVTSARDGLAVLERQPVEIIISDYRMPGMNGVDFLRQVNARWPHTVRIVLSGYADTASIVEAINDGQIYKFVPKPWNDDELKVTIVNAIERYKLFKQNVELSSELLRVNKELQRLLNEKMAFLELEQKMLAATQSIFFSLPVAVASISNDGIVAQLNEAWAVETSGGWSALGRTAEEALPAEVFAFVDEVRRSGKGRSSVALNGRPGHMFGSVFRGADSAVLGTVLVFVGEERCR